MDRRPNQDPQKRIAIESFDHGSKDPNALELTECASI